MKWKFWLAGLLAGAPSMASAVPLDTIGTFCGTFPGVCRQGTESLMAVRGTGTNAYYVLEADPTTGALPVNVTAGTITATNPSVGTTGSAVPASATYIGIDNGSGNLVGALGDSSRRLVVVGAGTAGSAAGGVMTVQGSASGTAVPVSGTVAATQSGTWTVQPGNTANTTAWKVDGSAVTQPGNITQFGGSNVVTGTGTGGAGIPRVTVSSDSSLSATNLPTTVDVNVGLVGASTLRMVRGGSPSTTTVVASNDYSGTNVGTGAYVQLIASTANATNTVCLSSSNAAPLKIATGAAASEVDRIYLPGGGSGCYDINIPASTRISLRSLSGTASTGFFLYTGY